MEAVEAVLEAERKEGKAREARHKLTVERLRRQIVELQVGLGKKITVLGVYQIFKYIHKYHTMLQWMFRG